MGITASKIASKERSIGLLVTANSRALLVFELETPSQGEEVAQKILRALGLTELGGVLLLSVTYYLIWWLTGPALLVGHTVLLTWTFRELCDAI